ncbi:MAG: hypothetical protein ABI461_15070, partial [Polyangiaceae bacterium]
MDPLVRSALFIRRAFRRASGLTLAALLGAFVVFNGANAPLLVIVPALVLWTALVASRIRRKINRTAEVPALAEVELGVLLTIAFEGALLHFEGALGGAFSPALYVLVAFVTAYSTRAAGAIVVAFVIGFEALLRHYTLHETNLEGLIPHAAFVVAFAALNLIFLRAQMTHVRNAA